MFAPVESTRFQPFPLHMTPGGSEMQMKYKLTVVAAIAAIAGIASAQETVVKIGHVAPMSGAQAHYGKDNENGVRMAIEDLNAKGDTLAGKKVKLEIQAEDDAAEPQQGTGAATNPALTKPGYDTTYRIIANDNALCAALALYASDKLKLKKVAVIDDRTAYGQGVAEVFSKTAQSKGMQIVDQQFTNDKATDFMAILTAIKAKNPDAIFYGGMDPQAGPMLRQMEQLGMTNVKYFGGDGICTSEIAKLSGGAKTLGNTICAEGGASLQKMPGGMAWKARYDAKYPGQFQVYSPYTYDATGVLVDAMVRAGSTDPKKYIPFLKKTNYKGVTGTIQFE